MTDPKGTTAGAAGGARSPSLDSLSPDSLSPGIPLDQIGQALAAFYDDLVAEGVPESLAALVRRVRPPPIRAAVADAAPPPVKRGRIALVVEDEPSTRALAEALLEETELSVIGCDSAEGALVVLRERGGDVALIFADVRLSGIMSGLQLAAVAATLWPTARLVVTSGLPLERPEALPDQALFIAKPWRPFDVLVQAERATSEPQPPIS